MWIGTRSQDRGGRRNAAALTKRRPRSCLVDLDLPQQAEVAQHLARAKNYAGQRIIGDGNRQAGLFANALIEILDQRSAAGQHNAAIADIRAQFRGRAFQRDANRIHDRRDALGQGLTNFAVFDGDGLGYALDQVAALDLHGQRLVEHIRRANFDFDLFRRALADQQVVLALEVIHDGLVHLVPGHADGARIDDAGERNYRDIRGTAADVDDHVAGGLGDGQTRANGGHHRLLHQEDFAGLGAIGRILDRALFYLRNLGGHSDHDARMHQHLAVVRLLDKVIQHLFGDLEVGDNAVLHRLDGDDVARRTAQHLFRLFADRLYLTGVLVDRNDRGFVDNNALAPCVDEGVGRPQIDRKIAGEHAKQRAQPVRPRRTRLKTI